MPNDKVPSEKPPKEWVERVMAHLREAYPDKSDEERQEIMGNLWYHQMKRKTKVEERAKYGKVYGKAGKSVFELVGDALLHKSVLTAKERNKLADSDFAIPEKRAYPIHDKDHAIDAIQKVDTFGSPEEKKRVKEAVHKRYPDIEIDGEDSHS